ncbi:MAG: hypothetical protein R3251_03845 [Candidatus Spechtbacterales bacterium]|nr:hypothetical protein [Candidatus Spechtbacterales bacterium]
MNIDLTTVILLSLGFFLLGAVIEGGIRHKKIKDKRLEKPHSDRIEFALHHIKHKGIKKIKKELWQEITGTSRDTATHDLEHLVELGLLKKKGRGRGIHYVFTKHEK